jgi:hypothetical protein
MTESMSDSLLELIWDRHLDGHRLSSQILAQMTNLGPEIRIQKAQTSYRWRKGRELRSGHLWPQVPFLL